MNYGKNQQALLKFLEKYPNKWHRVKRRKAIDAARRLNNCEKSLVLCVSINSKIMVMFCMPQMLIKQN